MWKEKFKPRELELTHKFKDGLNVISINEKNVELTLAIVQVSIDYFHPQIWKTTSLYIYISTHLFKQLCSIQTLKTESFSSIFDDACILRT